MAAQNDSQVEARFIQRQHAVLGTAKVNYVRLLPAPSLPQITGERCTATRGDGRSDEGLLIIRIYRGKNSALASFGLHGTLKLEDSAACRLH